MNQQSQNILIVRTDRMGDVILTTPALTALKRDNPGVKIGMLIAPYTAQVIDGHPDLDYYFFDDDQYKGVLGAFRLAKKVKTLAIDQIISVYPTFRLALIAWLAQIPRRTGTSRRLYSFFFNDQIKISRKNATVHESQLNLQFVGSGLTISDIDLKFYIPTDAEIRVDQLLKEKNIPEQYIVIHSGSGGSARDWPLEKFSLLADKIYSDLKITVVLTGTSGEKIVVDRVVQNCISNPIRVDGELNIKELGHLLKKSSVMIANSTGPLHLAVAVGTNIVGLYCPLKACHPDRWGPYRREDSVLMPDIEICKKYKHGSSKEKNCMDEISLEQVFNAVKKTIEAK